MTDGFCDERFWGLVRGMQNGEQAGSKQLQGGQKKQKHALPAAATPCHTDIIRRVESCAP